ncbi:MAG: transposase [Lachnospiraceae bacterium]
MFSLFRESFKKMLQELFEAEIDASIGYHEKNGAYITNKRNGYSSKTVISQLPNHQRDTSGIGMVSMFSLIWQARSPTEFSQS